MTIDSEGSLIGSDGELRHFGQAAFVNLASDTSRCFVCRAADSETVFDDEHVIPDWLLRRFKLHSRRATLPNCREMMYGRYKLRCCQSCNRLLGQAVEDPVSRLFAEEFEPAARALSMSPTLLYQWLCLLFIKLHLKDREIRIDPDTRRDSDPIGEVYDWSGLHHIHSVARTAQSRASIGEGVVGTVLVFEMCPTREPFDFGSLSQYSTILVRIGPVGIVSVLNDCGYVGSMVREYLSRISGPLSAIQLREVAARLAYGNTLLPNRPQFWTELDRQGGLTIRSKPPTPGVRAEVDRMELGALMAFSCGPLLLRSDTPSAEEKLRQLERGQVQFLYHDDGSFIKESWIGSL